MGHKFAYWVMFWSPLHLTMSASFLVMDILYDRDVPLIAIWLFNLVWALANLFLIFPHNFMELAGEEESKPQKESLIRTI